MDVIGNIFLRISLEITQLADEWPCGRCHARMVHEWCCRHVLKRFIRRSYRSFRAAFLAVRGYQLTVRIDSQEARSPQTVLCHCEAECAAVRSGLRYDD